jgi:hypothetical protein
LICELTDYRGARDAMIKALRSESQDVKEAAAELLMIYWPNDTAGLDAADLAAVERAKVADLEVPRRTARLQGKAVRK